jgi:hypothetical protein
MTIEAVQVPTRSSVWTAQDAAQAYALLTGDPAQAAKFGEYDEEGKARSQGMALDRLIKANHGRRFGTSVWKNEAGKFIGALLPREPVQRKPVKPKGK